MKVYAEYIIEKDVPYRKNTLLQFGESWELIGSAVLKNPGSALPQTNLNLEEAEQVKNFIGDNNFKIDTWYEFLPDQTMWILAKIFSGGFIGEPRDLNGVIQLFNLINYKDPDILLAKNHMKTSNSHLIYPSADKIITSFQDKPIYLGWFDFWKNSLQIQGIAETIFDHVCSGAYCYITSTFERSKLYHPLYVNRAYNKNWVREGLLRFNEVI